MNRALCIILILSSFFLCSLSYTAHRYARTALDDIQTENTLEKVSVSFTNDFQTLKDEEADYPTSETLSKLLSEYEQYNPMIEDISSGINPTTFPERILKHPKIKTFLENPQFPVKSYGWINATAPNAKTLKDIAKSYKNEASLFPLVNSFSLLNIHYVEEETLKALFEVENFPNSTKKSEELYYKAQETPLLKSDIAKILEVPQNHKIFSLLGTKTTFWKAKLHLNKKCEELILAAVPSKDEREKIEKYIVIKERVYNEK